MTYELRYRGQAFELPVPGPERPDPAELAERFAEEHERRYGYRDPEARRRAREHPRGGGRGRRLPRAAGGDLGSARAPHAQRALRRPVGRGGGPARRAGGRRRGRGPVHLRAARGDAGPAARLAGDESTIAARSSRSELDDRPGARTGAGSTRSAFRCWSAALRAACDEMGAVLIRSAHSANIKERHDCSTALFDPAGELVMQAEHIPVHLGSMPDAVAAVLDEDHRPGDAWILNDPYRGGTHLPDVTLISPIFDPGGGGSDRLTRLCGQPRTSRGHRRADAGRHAGRSARARGRGGGDPADARDRRDARGARAADEEPVAAPRRPPRAAGREPHRRAAAAGAARARRPRRPARRDGRDPGLRGAPHARRARRAARRNLRGRGRPGGRRRRPGAGYPPVRERPDRGRPAARSTSRAPTPRSRATSTARSP